MTAERVVQIGVIVAATVAGYLTRAHAVSRDPGRGSTTASPQRTEPALGAPAPRPREPRGWRRPAGAAAAQFEPAVVSPEEFPSDDLPTDEPRNPAWAEAMEYEMSRMLDRRLAEIFPAVKATVQCRTTTCRVEMPVPPPLVEKVTAFVALAVPLGATTEPSWDNRDPDLVMFSIEVDLSTTPTLEDWRRWGAFHDEHQRSEADRLIKAEKEGTPWFPEP